MYHIATVLLSILGKKKSSHIDLKKKCVTVTYDATTRFYDHIELHAAFIDAS